MPFGLNIMKIYVKSFLLIARKLKYDTALKTAYFLTKEEDSVLECYDVACHHFLKSNIGFDVILRVIENDNLPLVQKTNPFILGFINQSLEVDDLKQLRVKISKESQAHEVKKFISFLEYMELFIKKDFVKAYEIWRSFDATKKCLFDFERDFSNVSVSSREIAVVLPGTSDTKFGSEIDNYDYVGRTVLYSPLKEKHEFSGSRLDYSFLNRDKYIDLSNWNINNLSSISSSVVSNSNCRKVNISGLKNKPILELEYSDAPTSEITFIILRIANWCVKKAFLKPCFYNGDFYLSEKAYESEDYDLEKRLEHKKNIIDSYLRHDIFFVHASLAILYQKNLINAKGALKIILEMSGVEFAEALNRKWNDNINI